MTLKERQIEQEKVVAVLTSNHEDMKEDIANLKQGQKDLLGIRWTRSLPKCVTL